MTDLIPDIALLTDISESTLKKLSEISTYCIYQDILEDELAGNDISTIDLGIGQLYIKHDSEDIKCKFVPSDRFKKDLLAIKTKKLNLLEGKVNSKLSEKLFDVYRYLC